MNREIELNVVFTNFAVNKINEIWGFDVELDTYNRTDCVLERLFFDDYYDYYLQNATKETDDEVKARILLASDTDSNLNSNFISFNNDKIIAFEGLNTDEGTFLITNVKLIPKGVGHKPSKSIFMKIKLSSGSIRAIDMPKEIMKQLSEMPNAKEFNKKVDKNIKDWDDYLNIIEQDALKSQLEIGYTGYKLNDSLSDCIFYFDTFNLEQTEKLKNFRNERVILFGTYISKNDADEEIHYEFEAELGKLNGIDYKSKVIKIELEDEFADQARAGEIKLPQKGSLRISKMGDLSQARNLRRGLRQLRMGNSQNKGLDSILFDSANLGYNIIDNIKLDESNLLNESLNEKQKKAVEGVLNAKDLYLIQGPPGTGKTTVISEICYQNALRGMKTLISSQTNLAVDNALSKLIHNPKIRALRKGNFERIDDEGIKFAEENVVDTWMAKTANSCMDELNKKKEILNNIENLDGRVDRICSCYSNLSDINKNIANTTTNQYNKILESEEMHTFSSNIEQQFRDVDNELCKTENLLGNDESNNIIFSLLKRLREKVICKPYLIAPVMQNKIISNAGEIENTLKINCSKQNYAAMTEQNIVVIKNIKIKLQNRNYDKINNTDNEVIIENLYEFKRDLESLKEKDSNKKRIEKKVEIFKSFDKKVKSTLKLLEKLKDEYQFKDMVFVQKTTHEINEDTIYRLELEAAGLYNYKPNKFLTKLGLKKKWVLDVLCKIKTCEDYIGNISETSESLYKEKEELLDEIKDETSKLIHIINITEDIYISELQSIKDDIYSNIDNILCFNEGFVALKKEIMEDLDEKQSDLDISIMTLGTSINLLQSEKDELQKEITEYNKEVNKIFNVDINIENVAKLQNIKNFYTSIWTDIKNDAVNYINIVEDWTNRIKQKKYGDKNELQQLYISAANVIGITCVQSGRRDFSEDYPDFDVVIVDEVSKATPPELVLPLLKGKKLVLVGDHKQLPPMIGSQTFDELKLINDEEHDEEYEDLESGEGNLEYMKKSLFEELYTNVCESNKVMLNMQYRMHSSIMKTINQFYTDTEEKGLISMVKNEDVVKNHNYRLSYLNEDNHIIWVDVPLHKNYKEEENSSKSFYNNTEAEIISEILKDLNNNFDPQIHVEKSEVAVITFYGAQAKLLNNIIYPKNGAKLYNNLKIRVGTVDRFQGIEREIVIVSFVRNNKNGKIGFAKDPKRINVALSRAQKLLIIVGCSELFCEKNYHKEAKEYYRNVLKVVDEYNGIIDTREVFNKKEIFYNV